MPPSGPSSYRRTMDRRREQERAAQDTSGRLERVLARLQAARDQAVRAQNRRTKADEVIVPAQLWVELLNEIGWKIEEGR